MLHPGTKRQILEQIGCKDSDLLMLLGEITSTKSSHLYLDLRISTVSHYFRLPKTFGLSMPR